MALSKGRPLSRIGECKHASDRTGAGYCQTIIKPVVAIKGIQELFNLFEYINLHSPAYSQYEGHCKVIA